MAIVALLDADPDLGRMLAPAALPLARQRVHSEVRGVPAGPCTKLGAGAEHGLGVLVLRGVVLRQVSVAGRSCAELVGPGDVLRPWAWDDDPGSVRVGITWDVLRPVELAVLSRRTAEQMAPWPQLVAELLERSVRRTHTLAVQLAIRNEPRLEVRLLALLWHIADRWGVQRTDGVRINLPLTHGVLAALTGAPRSSVSRALHALAGRGAVRRENGGAWTLPAGLPDGLGA